MKTLNWLLINVLSIKNICLYKCLHLYLLRCLVSLRNWHTHHNWPISGGCMNKWICLLGRTLWFKPLVWCPVLPYYDWKTPQLQIFCPMELTIQQLAPLFCIPWNWIHSENWALQVFSLHVGLNWQLNYFLRRRIKRFLQK